TLDEDAIGPKLLQSSVHVTAGAMWRIEARPLSVGRIAPLVAYSPGAAASDCGAAPTRWHSVARDARDLGAIAHAHRRRLRLAGLRREHGRLELRHRPGRGAAVANERVPVGDVLRAGIP